EILLKEKVNVNEGGPDGVTPLHCAVRKQHRKVLPVLLKAGGDLYAKANDGSTPVGAIQDADYRSYIAGLLSSQDGRAATAATGSSKRSPLPVSPRFASPGPYAIVLEDGAQYTGETLGGVMHGMGTMTFPSGDRYHGSWHKGRKHGFGQYKFANGDNYEGQWHNGAQSGKGVYAFSNGGRLEGTWQNGRFLNGSGRYVFADGDSYEGQWRSDKMWGSGTYMTAAGKVFRGYWEKNEFVAPSFETR
ncbi:MAG: hypothetical protein GWM98_05000, partial [Nitrospinaceae bacterium]|nr:hypothetical protein [Nitrospinaceae bacterium]